MKILYVAKHGSGGNNDEDAITHSFRALGHEVILIPENNPRNIPRHKDYDFCLFHKWDNIAFFNYVRSLKVFWWFDLVDWPDPETAKRSHRRVNWMRKMVPRVDFGFLSDGDWVNQDTSGKLYRLNQGADERDMCKLTREKECDILFTGIAKGGGFYRRTFVQELEKIPYSFRHIKYGTHGKELAEEIAKARIVVAPDSPVTDYYWSNRVYLSLGFGAFLLHPYCDKLAEQYKDGEEIVFYCSREELKDKIAHYVSRPNERNRIARNGFEKTKECHLYRHRCQELLDVITTGAC